MGKGSCASQKSVPKWRPESWNSQRWACCRRRREILPRDYTMFSPRASGLSGPAYPLGWFADSPHCRSRTPPPTAIREITPVTSPSRQPDGEHPTRRSGTKGTPSPFIPANTSMRSSVRRSAQSPVDRLSFSLFVRVGLPENAQEARLGEPRRLVASYHKKALAIRTFIVQNGPAWS